MLARRAPLSHRFTRPAPGVADRSQGWRDAAVMAVEQAMTLGTGSSPRERELEREVDQLRSALAQATLERAIAMQGVEEWKRASRPSQPARSRR